MSLTPVSPDSRVRVQGKAKRELWLRLKRYHFDHLVPADLTDHVLAVFGGPDAATRAFASKLTRKLHWTSEFACRAIDEYKKFLYLGAVAKFSVTPSKVIDQVWHEHLLFSRPYQEFCAGVLGRAFHHHPELMQTDDQTERFQSQYEATLELYETEFHHPPPVDIWGTPKFAASIEQGGSSARRKGATRDAGAVDGGAPDDDPPLYLYFDGGPSVGGESYQSMSEFGGGGEFAGGGGGSSWDASSGTGDSAGAGVSSGGGDAGGSDGGSGCSSGCGGGCGSD